MIKNHIPDDAANDDDFVAAGIGKLMKYIMQNRKIIFLYSIICFSMVILLKVLVESFIISMRDDNPRYLTYMLHQPKNRVGCS